MGTYSDDSGGHTPAAVNIPSEGDHLVDHTVSESLAVKG
jgi:hypothetical protein